jgi:hypothetical protein
MSSVAKEDRLIGSDRKHFKQGRQLFRSSECICEERCLWKPLEPFELGAP